MKGVALTKPKGLVPQNFRKLKNCTNKWIQNIDFLSFREVPS